MASAAEPDSGRVALISGASRGIGAAIAEELFSCGWRLSLGMRSAKQPAWDTGAAIHLHRYDATEPDAEVAWVNKSLEKFGRIDAIVANAGVLVPKTLIEADDADLDAMLEVNVKAPRRLAKAAWDSLVKTGRGRVIILASLSGKRVKSSKSALYSISKYAAIALAQGIRHTGFDKGIRATAVCPGFVATDMARSVTNTPDDDMTHPRDIARIVAMLLELPNEASVAEFTINCRLEESY
jgi:NADP-dependent 3-hydroxy acid dehydrogenase YdfG